MPQKSAHPSRLLAARHRGIRLGLAGDQHLHQCGLGARYLRPNLLRDYADLDKIPAPIARLGPEFEPRPCPSALRLVNSKRSRLENRRRASRPQPRRVPPLKTPSDTASISSAEKQHVLNIAIVQLKVFKSLEASVIGLATLTKRIHCDGGRGDFFVKAGFVLAVKADVPAETLRRNFPHQAKVGPVEQIAQLVNVALPGIGLRPLPVAPRQLPYLANAVYFEMEHNGPHWKQMQQPGGSGGIAIYVPGEREPSRR
jgi:hypothetical protein